MSTYVSAYSHDEDLLLVRKDALDLGEDSWSELHKEAKSIIDERLEALWYRDQAMENGIDPDDEAMDVARLDIKRLRRLSCYKVLELIYQQQMKTTQNPDGHERLRAHFRNLFDEEFQTVMATGLGYDWDASGAIDDDERRTPRLRRMKRC